MENASARPQDRVGTYELVRLLGSGGMGEVWEAVLHGPDGYRSSVALKLLRTGPADAEARQALMNEARLGALLRHPNIVAVGALGEADGRWHLAMELVRGLSVSALAAVGPLPPRVVVDIGVQACAGLGHIHALQVDGRPMRLVHRDIKGQNLLVDKSGSVKIADLGVAGFGDALDGGVATAGYTAPEQLDRRPEARSDLFSLGVVLYLIATGRRPFGRGSSALEAVRDVEAMLADPAFLSPVDAAVAGLGAVVRGCLRADPSDRWPNAHALGVALGALRPHQPSGPTLLDLLASIRPELAIEDPSVMTPGPTFHVSRGNLSPSRDRFLGRAAEVAELIGRIRTGERLLSLVGPGGTGKTRLAREAVRALGVEPPGGFWFFDLSEARSVDGVCFAVGSALGLALERADPVRQVGYALRARGPAVLILDNLEQCVDHLAETIGRWATIADSNTFVCTSRVPLRLSGERVVPIEPLTTDDGVALFMERRVRHAVGATADPAEVRVLVETLEGFPLAIELAAARTRLLPVPEITRRLTVDLRVLSGGGEERPERHRSVEGSLRWSWDLLSEAGRRNLAELSVFDGGFDLSAASAVLSGERPALEALEELVEASLLRVLPDEARFSLLVVVQQFASRQLTPTDRRLTEIRHGEYFAQHGSSEALTSLMGPTGTQRLWELVEDIENLVSACIRAVTRGDVAVATGAALAAWEVFSMRGPFTAGIALLERVHAMSGTTASEASDLGMAHVGAALAAALATAGRTAESVARSEAALAVYQRLGDRSGAANLQRALGWRYHLLGGQHDIGGLYASALNTFRETGDRQGEGGTLASLGLFHAVQGRVGEARVCYEAALTAHREVGNRRAEGQLLGNLGALHLTTGDLRAARTCLESALALLREVGDRRGEGFALGNLAVLSIHEGKAPEGQRRMESALAVHREIGDLSSESVGLTNLGILHRELGHADLARACYEASLAINREVRNSGHEGTTLVHLGILHQAASRMSEARSCFEAALAIHQAATDPRREGTALEALGGLHAEEGRTEEAHACFALALALHRGAGDQLSVGMTLASLGSLYLDEGDLERARPCLETALELHREAGDPGMEALDKMYLAELALGLGQRDQAITLLEEALTALEGRDVRPWIACLGGLGELRGSADPVAGARDIDRAIAAARTGGWPRDLAAALCRRARACGDRAAWHEAESIATALGAGPGCRLGADLQRTRTALEETAHP